MQTSTREKISRAFNQRLLTKFIFLDRNPNKNFIYKKINILTKPFSSYLDMAYNLPSDAKDQDYEIGKNAIRNTVEAFLEVIKTPTFFLGLIITIGAIAGGKFIKTYHQKILK